MQRPNFDGHYSFVTRGCGSGCEMGTVVDQITGKVAFVPFSICCADTNFLEPDFDSMKFRRDSRPIVFTASATRRDWKADSSTRSRTGSSERSLLRWRRCRRSIRHRRARRCAARSTPMRNASPATTSKRGIKSRPEATRVTVEASNVVKLLRELGRSDLTCRAMADWVDHASTTVLEVCHEALTRGGAACEGCRRDARDHAGRHRDQGRPRPSAL